MRTTLLAGVFFVFLALHDVIVSAADLQCYQCRACNDPFDKTNVDVVNGSCSQGSCMKMKVSYGIVTRLCSPIRMAEGCVEEEKGEVCACHEDLCNNGNKLAILATATFVIAALVLPRIL